MRDKLLIIIGWDRRVLDHIYPGLSTFESTTVLCFLQLIEIVRCSCPTVAFAVVLVVLGQTLEETVLIEDVGVA